MGDAGRVSGNNLDPTEVSSSKKHKPTVGKIIFWAGVFFAGVAILTQAGLFLPHLAAFSFEFKILAIITAAIGCIAMVLGHKKIEHEKQEIRKKQEPLLEEDLVESYLDPAIQVSNTIERDPDFNLNLPHEGKSVHSTLYYDPQENLCFLKGKEEICMRAYQLPHTIISRKDNRYYVQLAIQTSNINALVKPKECSEELTLDQLFERIHNALSFT